MRAEEGFQFERFRVASPWSSDPALRLTILRLFSSGKYPLGTSEIKRLFDDLTSFGKRVEGEYADIAATLDTPQHEPTLVQYDAWGKRVDKLVTGEGWKRLKGVCASDAIVAESYARPEAKFGGGRDKLGQHARLYAFTRSVMFAPVSKVVLCPISMTDGAVRVLELFGTEKQKQENIPKLCSTDPSAAWTAGQWMTERPGGSDVSRTETVARPIDANKKPEAGDKFVISGFKWFSSATDGDVALALARTSDDLKLGSKGLSLFLIKIRDDTTGKLNGIRVHRLKRKLGTKYLPTAELELDGCIGELVGEISRGVATISSVLNITRLYSAGGAVGALSWGLRSATAYAQIRPALGGGKLDKLPLHTDQLLKVTVTYRVFLQIFFSNVLLMGASESGQASKRDLTRLRLLTPALKAFVATRASESYLTLIESFGGQGYMEEVGMAEMLRDCTVERIWEGTPAILSLDVLRVLVQSRGQALIEFFQDISANLTSLPSQLSTQLDSEIKFLSSIVQKTASILTTLDLDRHVKTTDLRFSRYLLDLIMAIQGSSLLLSHAAWKMTTFAQSAELQSLAEVKADERELQQDVHLIRLWIGGASGDGGAAGFADLARLVSQLEASTTEAKVKGEDAVDLGHGLVYSWDQGTANEVKSHL
ncbi:acyl-CoA dehydrogenase [Pseudozyma hubeiensis SY62]|uniref:Acyl-CoA dehydrogenase n=1 Tax=Pseudozyma hubeiensis (strain SY62) TaxID=1305764 RepID=R9P5J0_PSEHS|nr:acyl-CoA dehydrogenase [Pseudozyma hubeiensis SY62]GAC96693.1 acyl-CoA dehydrogenase [Pseudozyma hubeiensis SY62]